MKKLTFSAIYLWNKLNINIINVHHLRNVVLGINGVENPAKTKVYGLVKMKLNSFSDFSMFFLNQYIL